ncbi:MAG: MaoC family dehydratase [Chloroflexi bacterium]|nr:MaoC family dehydratase [Chloroflexota bacterium]
MSHKESWDQIQVGEEITPLTHYVTQDHINKFQGFLGHAAAGPSPMAGHNLHVDEEYSREHMFGGNVGDGHQTIAYLCELATNWLPYGALVSGYSEVDIRLTNPTRPGDRVVSKGVIKDKFIEDGRRYVLCEVTAVKGGDRIVAFGHIKAMVPDLKVKA